MSNSQIRVTKTNSYGDKVTYIVDKVHIYPDKIRLLWLSGKHFDFPFKEIRSFTFSREYDENKTNN